tara:strand:+ start:3933 stop:4397 length:465 start_codon:yes stop_codon:yes gene_type:complete
MDFFKVRNKLYIDEAFKLPKPPFKTMHITGFSAKLKMNQEAMHDDNTGPQVIKDVKSALKIVEKHFKKLGLKYKEDEVLKGPKTVKGFKFGSGAADFELDIYPGFPGKNPTVPSGKVTGDINFDDMVTELGKLKSFVNFPRSDWSVNYGEPGKK